MKCENEKHSHCCQGTSPKNEQISYYIIIVALILDGFTKVTDKDAAVFCRELLKQEGMFLGNSAGAAIKGGLQLKDHFNPDDLVVVLFHDHGSRYLKKIYNDDWMQEMGYM